MDPYSLEVLDKGRGEFAALDEGGVVHETREVVGDRLVLEGLDHGVGDGFIDTWSVILGRHLPVHRSANGIISLEFCGGVVPNTARGFKLRKKAPKGLSPYC